MGDHIVPESMHRVGLEDDHEDASKGVREDDGSKSPRQNVEDAIDAEDAAVE